jgi:uncharacterized membrane protein YccC
MIVLDRLPRVKMLYGGNFALVAILACLTALTAVSQKGTSHAAQVGGIVMLFCFSIVYSGMLINFSRATIKLVG